MKRRRAWLGVVWGLVLFSAAPNAAQARQEKRDPSAEEKTSATEAEGESQATSEERIEEIERQIQLLSEEIEKLKLGEVAEEKPRAGKHGLAPAASKIYGIERGLSLGGYGEVLFQDFSSHKDDGAASGLRDQFDFLRAVVYLGYKWNDRILFNSEIEVEHASTGKKGEASLEFAYLDFFIRREVNLRGGMVLIPLGLVNELHEPPVFHGASRPEVEKLIIPTTWRENGGGAFGEIGPVAYRAYVVAGLWANGFTSSSAVRGGRQGGSRSLAEDLAWTGRVDVDPVTGLLAGAGFFAGSSGQSELAPDGEPLEGRVDLFDVHARYTYRGLDIRALYARGAVGDARRVNEALGLEGAKSIGSRFEGAYVEAAFDLLSLMPGGSSWSATPFFRLEDYDTQAEVPEGYVRDPANDRSARTLGLDVKPHPSVVLKVEYQHLRNQAGSGVNQWNFALGYVF